MTSKLRITCIKHNVLLKEMRCPICSEESRQIYENMQKIPSKINITVGLPSGPSRVIVNGVERPTYHYEDYVSVHIPYEISENIQKYINNKVAEFEVTCMCLQCQLHREKK